MGIQVHGTRSGETTLSFSLLPPFSIGVKPERKNLLLQEQILFFKVRPHFGRAMSFRGKQSGRHIKLFLFVKMAKNHA